MAYLGVTNIPMQIRSLDNKRARDMREMNQKYWRNPEAFTPWAVTLVFNILFIVMHITNFPDHINYPFYFFLIFGIKCVS